MAFYSDHILPRCINFALDNKACRELRAELCAGLGGEVLEIGFGSGLNLPCMPQNVDSVFALEPSAVACKLASRRIDAWGKPVKLLRFDGVNGLYPLDDASVDCALSSWTLCTVPDVAATLSEVRRVLRPGGKLHFLEHGLADSPRTQRWQKRLNPLQRRIGGGCHLDRNFQAILDDAGWRVDEMRQFKMAGPAPFVHMYRGCALPPT